MNHMFGKRLKNLRLERNLTQAEVSEMLGFTSQTVANYECGKREPRIAELILLADYFEVSIDYLVGRASGK